MNEVMRDTSRLTPIEIALGIDEDRMTTAKRLYEYLELNPAVYSRWIKGNILENEFAEEGTDYFPFNTNVECGGQASKDAKLTAKFAKKLSMTQKNHKGEAARDYFTSVEDGAKEMVLRMQEMSPQLQFMINVEIEQKRQSQVQECQAKQIEEVKENQRTITQAFERPSGESFRVWVGHGLSAIAESENYLYIGSAQERHQAIRAESYERLNSKRPCRLEQRVSRARGDAATAGATKTQINAINKLSIIEADKDLRTAYEAVIREMLIFYNIQL